MKRFLFLLIAFNLVLSFNLFASFPPGGPSAIPMDGGVVILVLAGAIYGIAKMKKQKEQEV